MRKSVEAMEIATKRLTAIHELDDLIIRHTSTCLTTQSCLLLRSPFINILRVLSVTVIARQA